MTSLSAIFCQQKVILALNSFGIVISKIYLYSESTRQVLQSGIKIILLN